MHKTLLTISLVSIAFVAQAKDTYVSPHITRDGRLVDGHFKSAPNDTKLDNYSTRGNVNPYTGQAGTKDPWAAPAPRYDAPSLNAPQPQRKLKF